MKEARYMIEQALEECTPHLKNYQGKKDHIKSSKHDLQAKEKEIKDLINKLHVAVNEFHDALKEEMNLYTDLSEVNKQIYNFLMQSAKASKIPDLETRIRTNLEYNAIYKDELQKLSLKVKIDLMR